MNAMYIGFGLVVVIPLTALILEHFQKIAAIRERQRSGDHEIRQRLEMLEAKLESMNEKMNALVLAADDTSSVMRRLEQHV
jgi:hypothetical protein